MPNLKIDTGLQTVSHIKTIGSLVKIQLKFTKSLRKLSDPEKKLERTNAGKTLSLPKNCKSCI